MTQKSQNKPYQHINMLDPVHVRNIKKIKKKPRK